MPLRRRKSAFNHSDFIFEVKWDGFRALAIIEHGRTQCFLGFDLLMRDGKDCRRERLLDRKQELRRVLSGSDARIQYVDYVDGAGIPLFNQICKHDLEGIVAKQKSAPYVTEREHSTWFKILNRGYSQKEGREELFERERHSEPIAGWHLCDLACAGLEQADAET